MAEPDTAVVVLPTVGAAEQMRAGCWASFYDERNFSGDSLTLIGPVELQTLDRGSAHPAQARHQERRHRPARHARRSTRSRCSRRARSASSPTRREAGLVETLGFGGRIESMQMTCSDARRDGRAVERLLALLVARSLPARSRAVDTGETAKSTVVRVPICSSSRK